MYGLIKIISIFWDDFDMAIVKSLKISYITAKGTNSVIV